MTETQTATETQTERRRPPSAGRNTSVQGSAAKAVLLSWGLPILVALLTLCVQLPYFRLWFNFMDEGHMVQFADIEFVSAADQYVEIQAGDRSLGFGIAAQNHHDRYRITRQL